MNESLYPFVNHTTYDLKALGAMNRLAELSVRREKSRRTKGICGVLGLIGLVGGVYCYPHQNLVGSLMMLYGVILLILLISWKNFQLRSSQRQLPQGMKECTYEFDEEEIICTTAAGEQRYSYEQVFAVVSDMAWYVIFFDASHGIILTRTASLWGTPGTLRPSSGSTPSCPSRSTKRSERMAAAASPGHFAAEKFVCPAPVRASTEEIGSGLLRPDVCNVARKEKPMRKELSKVYEPQEVEGRIYQQWEENKCFAGIRDAKKKPLHHCHAPPNVTGQLHMGHAMDCTLRTS